MVYKLRSDRNNYLCAEISPDELEQKLGEDHFFLLDEPTWVDFWVPMQVEFKDLSDNQNVTTPPDITCWFTDQLVLSEKAYNALKLDLEGHGEFLPLSCEGITYWLFHVTSVVPDEAVDQEHSHRDVEEGGFIDVKQLSFNNQHMADYPVFKTHYNGLKNVFCTGEFLRSIESEKLAGLLFHTDLASVL
ncbi:hypothetical protein R50073_16470 [Maricurvus nonylphenolicus]|uniref:imm11 family protein n=1 Tax=Maricurvus nonylphenolicus TaxID=1008307 RepID=UPI0036F2EBDF